jgi:hypothetical protein
VSGIIFGLLAVLVGIPGAVVAIHKLRQHRRLNESSSTQGHGESTPENSTMKRDMLK